MLASDLFALSQNSSNVGNLQCHWCGGSCKQTWTHGEPPAEVGTKKTYLAKFPANAYICSGCWLWRRPRVTLNYLDKTFTDGKCYRSYSLFITDREAFGIRFPDKEAYKKILKPPLRFCLALVDPGETNHIQLAVINDLDKIEADTPLHFTLNNKPLKYSVYELEHGLRYGTSGKEPGVIELIKRLGEYELPPLKDEMEGPGRRPPLEDARVTKKAIREGRKSS